MPKARLDQVLANLRFHLGRHGLKADDAAILFAQSPSGSSHIRHGQVTEAEVRVALHAVLDEPSGDVDKATLRVLVNVFCEELGFEMDTAALRTKREALAELARRVISVLTFAFVAYIVLGGVIEGSSALSSSPGIVFVCLGVTVVLLGSFEALQISVALLRLVDPHHLRESFPRAYSLHAEFKSELGTRRFLAGRQLFVIVIVFFAARATTFPEMTNWPFTGSPFPSWMSPWFELIFLRLGVAGALLVLWLGQLAPQFFANKRPLALLNLPGMGLVFRAALFVESLGLTRPGEWLTSRLHPEPRIPLSQREAYRQTTENIAGYGSLGILKEWEVSSSGATLTHTCGIEFHRDDIPRIYDRSVAFRRGARKGDFSQTLISRVDKEDRQPVAEVTEFADENDKNWRRVEVAVQPDLGDFRSEDVVQLDCQIEFDPTVEYEDILNIRTATKFALFRVRFPQRPQNVSSVKLTTYASDENTGKLTRHEEFILPLSRSSDGASYCEFLDLYPEVGAHYYFTWRAEY